ncbi:hypothetical protein CIL05_14390 [Virgibacillus profundi]|uniref:DUF1641 domain-containing protein n=1 Tax=Virgibacillus profundi TaxID=2024555 RepID=A0A2A2IB61_9BACI|nr:DUF1641 domain-containing protein [Virgibacillus profundi]PAV28812.1 hypothetical protein CIL05_14390 [Virgibacillus profundi]PXY52980.1 DUF1641 domain-containing protein [Virgibacillus profundi]
MADPISKIKRMEIPEELIHEKDLTEVSKKVSENKEAILKGIDLLAAINESEALDTINALVKHRKEALENIVQELNKPGYSATLENLSDLFLFLGQLNVDELFYFTDKLNHGMKEARASNEDGTSYMGLIGALKDPDINRSITLLLSFLRGMGKEL